MAKKKRKHKKYHLGQSAYSSFFGILRLVHLSHSSYENRNFLFFCKEKEGHPKYGAPMLLEKGKRKYSGEMARVIDAKCWPMLRHRI